MRKLLAKFLFASALATTAAACGHTPPTKSFVQVDQVALGKVVVYRNGVAFYERRATVHGGKLTVSVPRERVDDFLKSLTVVDAKTQLPLPVSFPRQQSESGPFLEMTLDVPMATKPGETADVLLTYVTEAPVWKPSYRIAVGKNGKVMIEGWAIVDNTSGEDWKDVMVGVGSSSALSFRYDLWSVRTVQRETLEADEQFAVAPPTAVSPYGGTASGPSTTMVAELGDDEIRRPPGHPDNFEEQRVPEAAAEASLEDELVALGGADIAPSVSSARGGGGRRGKGKAGGTAGSGSSTRADKPGRPTRVARAEPAPPRDTARDYRRARVGDGDRKIAANAAQIIKNQQHVVIEGYGDAGEAGSEQRAFDRANIVRNQLIDAGVPPAQIRVVNRGVVPGQKAGVRMIAEAPRPDEVGKGPGGKALDPAAAPVGESHFQSTMPMTVAKGTSVMVSMVRAETEGEEVYLFDPESDRGNSRFAFNAVRLKNPTEYTLETGPVTVYGKDRYIGEGLTEPIPPSANVVVPFALDRQVVVDRDDVSEHQVSKLVTLQRGVLTAEVQHIKRKKLTFTSRLHKDTKVYVRETPQKGWMTLEAPEHYWRIGDAYLYEIDLKAGESKTVEFAEATPMTRTLDLGSPTTLDMMKVFVNSPQPSAELKKQLESLLAVHREMIDTADKITSLRERAVEYRQRMDELQDQIVSLKKVKSAASLQRNLSDKMKDISNRVQQTTIDVVDAQEKLMLARVRFQDQLAEMTLPDVAANLASKKP
jgi:hypothetical protein